MDERCAVTELDVTLVEQRGKRYLAIHRDKPSSHDAFVADDSSWCEKICATLAELERPDTIVMEVPSDEPGPRVFVVQSIAWLAYERAFRDRPDKRTRAARDELGRPRSCGKLKAMGNMADRTGCDQGRWFRFFEQPDPARERQLEGHYVIRAEVSGPKIVAPAEALGRVNGMNASIFVTALVFWLDRALKRMRRAPLPVLAREALQALRETAIVLIETVDGSRGTSISARGRGVRASAQWSTPDQR